MTLVATLCLALLGSPGSSAIGSATPASEAVSDSVVFWGPNWSFGIAAAHGWVVDSESARPPGWEAIVRPANTTRSDSSAYISVGTIDRSGNFDETLPRFVRRTIAESRRQVPHARIWRAGSMLTGDSRRALLVEDADDRRGVHELTAVIETPTVFVRLSLVASRDIDFEEGRPVFIGVVKSFCFLTTEVRVAH